MVVLTISLLVVALVFKEVQGLSFIMKNSSDSNLQVTTKSGTVQGTKGVTDNGITYFSYRGIPYAKPPIKHLRFRIPKPVDKWNGILDATKAAPGCIETRFRLLNGSLEIVGSEDCLFLNVYTPLNPRDNNTVLAVLVYIYGGAFIEGNSELYRPDYLLEQGIIVVTFDYRLGLFGFLSTEDLASPGNYGLHDQLMAIKWVKENIYFFGGNESQVILNGQSAGAAFAIYHMLSPLSKNLFNGVIAQTGTPLTIWSLRKNARDVAFRVGRLMGIETNSSKQLLSFLRKVDERELKQIQLNAIILSVVEVFDMGLPFSPVIEPIHKNAFLTKSSYDLLSVGNITNVPIIIGFNSEEFKAFRTYTNIIMLYSLIYDLSPGSIKNINRSAKLKSIVGNKIKQYFFKSGSFVSSTREEFSTYFSEELFIRPTIKTIQFLQKYCPVFFYLFSYEGEVGIEDAVAFVRRNSLRHKKGVGHGEDLRFIWKMNKLNTKDELISKRILRMWTNFVRTGNPTPSRDNFLENISWPAVTSDRKIKYLDIGNDLNVKSYDMKNVAFWEQIYNRYNEGPIKTY